METDLWDAKFGIEVSARYHDWRRGTVLSRVRFAKACTFVGAIVTLLISINPESWAPGPVLRVIGVLAAIIAIIGLWDLVARMDEAYLQHTDLYRRFAMLQAKMAKAKESAGELLPDWEAEAALIRKDEPPTMWAVYAACWNQTVERYHGKDGEVYLRKVGWVRNLLRNELQFRPQDFPLATAG
jgi:hypothetical protein